MATTRRGNIGVTMTNTPQEEVEELADEMVEALTKFEEEQRYNREKPQIQNGSFAS